jgi:hypothetical protein
MLIVYATIRQITPEIKVEGRARAVRATQIIYDAIGRNDIPVELVTGEDWIAKSESLDSITPTLSFLMH